MDMLFSVSKGSMIEEYENIPKNKSKQIPHCFITVSTDITTVFYFSPIMLWSKLTVAAI